MFLFRTVCSTDWKGRPSHKMSLVAQVENREQALKSMTEDIASWMAEQIAMVEISNFDEDPGQNWENERIDTLLSTKKPTELLEMWKDGNNRFEMQLADTDHREFVNKTDGDICTIVYHLLNSDFSYAPLRWPA